MNRAVPSQAVGGLVDMGDTRGMRAVALVRGHGWSLVVWIGIVGWALAYFALARERYLDFGYARFDLGNMAQAVWSTAHGRPLEVTEVTGEQMSRLGLHVDPILVLLTPLWMVASTPLALVAVQIVVVALGALPVFWLARKHAGSERTAGLIAFAYLAYPWLAWSAVDAMHPLTLAIPLLLFAVWFLDEGRMLAFVVCALLAVTAGELVGLAVAALGVWYALVRGARAAGVAIAAAGTAWTIVAVYVVVPAFAGAQSQFMDLYEHVGGSPWGVLRTAFMDPETLFDAVVREPVLLYVFALAAPLAGAFLLAPALAAVALPQLGINALADFSGTTDPHAHYIAGIVPFLFAGLATGLSRLRPGARTVVAGYVLALCLAASLVVGPLPGAVGGHSAEYWGHAPPHYVAALNDAVALVPDGAPVSSSGRVGALLAARRFAYHVPAIGRAEWIVLDSSDTWMPRGVSGAADPEAFAAFLRRVERSPEWQRVFEAEGVHVFQKVAA